MAADVETKGYDIEDKGVAGEREARLLHIVHNNDALIDFALSLICQIEPTQKKGQTPASQEKAL